MNFEIQKSLKKLPAALIIPLAKEDVKSPQLKAIATLANISVKQLKQDLDPKFACVQMLYTPETKLFILGVGEQPNTHQVIRAFRTLSNKFQQQLPSDIGIHLLQHPHKSEHITAIVNGLLLGPYTTGKYKTTEDETHPLDHKKASITIYTKLDKKTALAAAEEGAATAATQRSILDLMNAPSNKKAPEVLADWAVRSGKENDFKVTVFDKAKITKLGLDALLAVNRGSETPPRFIIMEYKGKKAKQTIGLLGKGVTFDTGGVSLKPSTNMHLMKSDMGGAGAVLGTMELAAKLQLPVHLIGIVPTTDNSIGTMAIKPSDVINSYSGKTIEIIDTDAEGRLILADALAYMVKHFKPDVMIDLATLTGSAVRTFGYHAGALFSDNDDLIKKLYAAAEATGEKIWQLPLWEEYEEDLKSDVADVRNFSGRPLAGAIGAAKFLQFFTNEHPAWAHLDIAGVAFTEMKFSNQKSATAFGIRLLTQYLKNLSR